MTPHELPPGLEVGQEKKSSAFFFDAIAVLEVGWLVMTLVWLSWFLVALEFLGHREKCLKIKLVTCLARARTPRIKVACDVSSLHSTFHTIIRIF